LSSGSRGNASLVEFGSTLLMIDCGLPLKVVEARLREVGREPRDVTALLVTHEHNDHAHGVVSFARRYNTPLWLTAGKRLGILTDAGHVTPHMCERLAPCDAIAVECNHDLDALLSGPYPESLKVRIASRYGHLNNAQTTELLGRLDRSRLQWVAALHLSERNNSPERVRAALGPALADERRPLHLATQDAPTAWLEVA